MGGGLELRFALTSWFCVGVGQQAARMGVEVLSALFISNSFGDRGG